MKPGQGKLHHSRASRLTHGGSTVATSMQPHGDATYLIDMYPRLLRQRMGRVSDGQQELAH